MHTILRLRQWSAIADDGVSRPGAPPVRPPRSWFGRAIEALLTWQERAAQRQALARLDDRMLRDIGISRADVARECAKQFWQA